MKTKKALQLENLSQLIDTISSVQCDYYSEGCMVALEKQGHLPGVELSIEGVESASFILVWDTSPIRSGWQEIRDIAEVGSIALAFFVILELTEYQVIEQSIIGSGFDFWLGYKEKHENHDPDNFLNARLEISGINKGSRREMAQRLRKKMHQLGVSDHLKTPGYVIIIEFGTPICIIVQK